MVYRLAIVLVFGGMISGSVQAAEPLPLLSKAASIENEEESKNEGELFAAIENDDLKTLQKLCEAGIGINNTSERKGWYTPLMSAAYKGTAKSVRILLDAGADKDAKHKITGSTALIHAIKNLDPDAVAMLLMDAKADINEANKNGETALWWAVEKGKGRLSESLIDLGAKVDVVSTYSRKRICCGETILTGAIKKKEVNFLAKRLLGLGASVDRPNIHGVTPLICAIEGEYPDTVQLLLTHKADVSKPNALGDTPLMVAAAVGNVHIVVALLDAGADPDQCNKDGKKASDCVEEPNPTIMSLLRKPQNELERMDAASLLQSFYEEEREREKREIEEREIEKREREKKVAQSRQRSFKVDIAHQEESRRKAQCWVKEEEARKLLFARSQGFDNVGQCRESVYGRPQAKSAILNSLRFISGIAAASIGLLILLKVTHAWRRA